MEVVVYNPKKVRKVGKTGRGITNSITNSLADITNSLTKQYYLYSQYNPSTGDIPSNIPSNSSDIPSKQSHNSLISVAFVFGVVFGGCGPQHEGVLREDYQLVSDDRVGDRTSLSQVYSPEPRWPPLTLNLASSTSRFTSVSANMSKFTSILGLVGL